MSELQSRIGEVTERIAKRSHDTRERYLDQVRTYGQRRPRREHLSCGNLAHGFAACDGTTRRRLAGRPRATSRSSPPTTTCSRRTSRSSASRR